MKYSTLFSLSAAAILFTSCTSKLVSTSNGKSIDERLVGTWVGSEKNEQIEGLEKKWEMLRNNDGTFILNFETKKANKVQNHIETGTWWIENGTFYELHNESGQTDAYKYKVLTKDKVKFIGDVISMDMNADEYTFIDTRKNTSTKDGLSYETAIKVNTVREEYEFVKANCKDCEITSQALSEYKGTPYDVLKANKPDGSSVSYYFNIKSFFGKF